MWSVKRYWKHVYFFVVFKFESSFLLIFISNVSKKETLHQFWFRVKKYASRSNISELNCTTLIKKLTNWNEKSVFVFRLHIPVVQLFWRSWWYVQHYIIVMTCEWSFAFRLSNRNILCISWPPSFDHFNIWWGVEIVELSQVLQFSQAFCHFIHPMSKYKHPFLKRPFLCFSVNMRDQVSCTYKTVGTITGLL
jgi:hypothetical protein